METITPSPVPPVIVESQTEFIGSLFVGPKTPDGFVIRRLKRRVDVFLAGQYLSVNAHRVWIRKTEDGRWTFIDHPQWTYAAMGAAADALVKFTEYRNGEIVASFRPKKITLKVSNHE